MPVELPPTMLTTQNWTTSNSSVVSKQPPRSSQVPTLYNPSPLSFRTIG